MVNHSLRPLMAALAALSFTLVACSKEKSPATAGGASGMASGAGAACPGQLPPDSAVATFGDQKITARELDERLKQPLYDVSREGLERLSVERLMAAEAKKRGVTQEQLLKAEVQDKVAEPPEEEMKKLFEDAKAQGQLPPEAPYELVKPQIVQFLQRGQLQKRMQEYLEQVKKDWNYQLTMPAPRHQVAATGAAKGPEGAPVTIVEFSDFQCPYCSKAAETVEQMMKEYEGKVRLVYRHYPLPNHTEAPKAAEASLCAQEQGKFWEFHDKLFDNQRELGQDKLKEYAQGLGLDATKFNECLSSGKHAAQVKADMEAGERHGVTGTPAFFINGLMISGALPPEEFKRLIDQELQGAQARK